MYRYFCKSTKVLNRKHIRSALPASPQGFSEGIVDQSPLTVRNTYIQCCTQGSKINMFGSLEGF